MRLLVPVTACALAACAGPTVQPGDHAGYSPTFPAYAFQHGGLGVDVRGGGNAAPVVADTPPPRWASRYAMVPAGSTAVARAYRIVLTFPPHVAVGDGVCAAPPATAHDGNVPRGEIAIGATLCVFEHAKATTRARGNVGDGPGDPRLAALLRAVVDELLPPNDASSINGRECLGNPC